MRISTLGIRNSTSIGMSSSVIRVLSCSIIGAVVLLASGCAKSGGAVRGRNPQSCRLHKMVSGPMGTCGQKRCVVEAKLTVCARIASRREARWS